MKYQLQPCFSDGTSYFNLTIDDDGCITVSGMRVLEVKPTLSFSSIMQMLLHVILKV